MTGPTRRDAAAMAACLAVLSIVTIVWGERIGVNEGAGWDGRAYAAWALDFPSEVLDHGVTAYQSERVIPSALVYYATSALGARHTVENAILGFQLLAAVLLIAGSTLLYRLARALAWSRAATWAGFAGLFLGFANARNALYYPTMTDTTAFVLGIATMWAYVERRPFALAAIAAISAFTWPALFPIAAAALVLPRATELPEAPFRWIRIAALVIAVACAVLVSAWLAYYLCNPVREQFSALWWRDLMVMTFACSLAMVGGGMYALARERRAWAITAYLRLLPPKRALIAIGVVVAIAVVRALWWAPRVATQGPGVTFKEVARITAEYALRGPLWNLVHHVVYFGPIIIVAIAVWPRIAAVAARWGPPMFGALAMTLMLAITTESRILSHVIPIVAILAIEATAQAWTPRRAATFIVLALVWSKLWWPIRYSVATSSFDWPDLRFMMQLGPWASDATYLVHLIAIIVTAVVLAVAFRGWSERAERPSG